MPTRPPRGTPAPARRTSETATGGGVTRALLVSLLVLVGLGAAALAGWFFLLAPRAPSSEATLRGSWAQRRVNRPNVVLITLDTTRADRIGAYGYAGARTPVLDGLGRRGALFTQAASPAPLTLPAHASMMTGLYPTYHGVRVNGSTALGEAQTTIAEALKAQGYRTGAFVAAFVLDGRWGLKQGFDLYDDQFDLKKFKHLDLAGVQRRADEVMDAALQWLDRHKDGPFFAWIHLYDPHTPYEPPEPLASELRSRGPAGLYDGEIAFADQQVGRCLSWLQDTRLDDRTIVVVAGDHGESLGSHGEGTHGYFVYDYALHVPLIVSAPFDPLRGVRVDEQVSLVDIFPTILAAVGIESATRVHGRSLLPLMFAGTASSSPEEVYAYAESMAPNLQYGWSALHALRSPRYKFIQAPRPELYDLVADPGETTNAIDEHASVARGMAGELERLMAQTSLDAPAPESANLDTDTLARLSSLGYLAGAASSPPKEAGAQTTLADPKDKLDVFNAVQRAGELMVQDQYGPAAEALESALRQEASMPQALLMLGSSYAELGRTKDAKAQFDRVLKEDPRSVQGLIGLANTLMAEGELDDVVALCKRTLSLDDRQTKAHALLGDVYIARREPSKALPYLERAVEIQPKLVQNRLNLAACLIEVRQLTRAQEMLDGIAREHPRFPGTRFNLGVLYEEQGRVEEARQAYAAELESHPNRFKARFNLGRMLARLGDWPGSIAQMRDVVRVAPKRPEGYLFLARGLLHESAPLDDVQRFAEQGLALARAPDVKALGWFLMADVFSRRGQPAKVDDALGKARRELALVKQGARRMDLDEADLKE